MAAVELLTSSGHSMDAVKKMSLRKLQLLVNLVETRKNEELADLCTAVRVGGNSNGKVYDQYMKDLRKGE